MLTGSRPGSPDRFLVEPNIEYNEFIERLTTTLPLRVDSDGPFTWTVVLYDSQLRSIDDFEEIYESWPAAARNP